MGDRAAAACGLPAPLFFKGESLDTVHNDDSPLTPAFWFHLTDYAIFPHLQLFGSAAELIAQLLVADFRGLSKQMETFNDATWAASAAFYRTALCLLSPEASAEGIPITPRFLPQPSSSAVWSRVCTA